MMVEPTRTLETLGQTLKDARYAIHMLRNGPIPSPAQWDALQSIVNEALRLYREEREHCELDMNGECVTTNAAIAELEQMRERLEALAVKWERNGLKDDYDWAGLARDTCADELRAVYATGKAQT